MLVISRKVGETVVVSDNIKITVVSVSNDKVALGIEAPKEIQIVREELLEIIEANKASTDGLDKLTSTQYKDIADLFKNKKND